MASYPGEVREDAASPSSAVPVQTRLMPAALSDRSVIESLIELYVHDLSVPFGIEIGPDGRFGYPDLDLYWREPERRFPFLIFERERLAGFILARLGSPESADPLTLDIAEYFVLRRHRREGVGRRAAHALWDRLPGRWTVRVLDRNAGAVTFWRRAVSDYTRGRFDERDVKRGAGLWHVLELESTAR